MTRSALPLLVVAALLLGACGNKGSTLYEAAALGESRSTAERYIREGSDVNAVNPASGWTPLHVAAVNGHGEMCDLLLEHGAEANARDRNGMTPLHLARARDHEKVARVLIARGADVGIRNNEGRTPQDMRPR